MEYKPDAPASDSQAKRHSLTLFEVAHSATVVATAISLRREPQEKQRSCPKAPAGATANGSCWRAYRPYQVYYPLAMVLSSYQLFVNCNQLNIPKLTPSKIRTNIPIADLSSVGPALSLTQPSRPNIQALHPSTAIAKTTLRSVFVLSFNPRSAS